MYRCIKIIHNKLHGVTTMQDVLQPSTLPAQHPSHFLLHVILFVLHLLRLGSMLFVRVIYQIWTRLDNIFCGLRLVLLEVLNEETAELGDLCLEAVVALTPSASRVQKL